jgi:uncharacterized membrane protein YraQ (UPF0718 family)
MFDSICIFILRAGQVVLNATPMILTGIIVAGVMRGWIGHETLHRYLGRTSVPVFLRSIAIAVLIPVCGIGVIPVLRELLLARVPAAVVVLFAVIAGAVNPWSIAYAMQISSFQAYFWIGSGMILSAVLAALVATGWDMAPRITQVRVVHSPGAVSVLLSCSQIIGSSIWVPIVLGVVCAALTATCIPAEWISELLMERNRTNIVILASLLVPLHIVPETAAVHVQQVLDQGGVPGASVAWLNLGAGMTFGTIWVFWRSYSAMRALFFVATVLPVVLIVSLSVNQILFDGTIALEDSHAFDHLARPLHLTDDPEGVVKGILKRWSNHADATTLVVVLLIVLLWVVRPVLLRILRNPPNPRHVGTGLLDSLLVGLFGICALLGLYVYYPSPYWILEQIKHPHAEMYSVARRGDFERAEQLIRNIERLNSKLYWSARIRALTLGQKREAAIENVTAAIAPLRTAVQRREPELAATATLELGRALREAGRDLAD